MNADSSLPLLFFRVTAEDGDGRSSGPQISANLTANPVERANRVFVKLEVSAAFCWGQRHSRRAQGRPRQPLPLLPCHTLCEGESNCARRASRISPRRYCSPRQPERCLSRDHVNQVRTSSALPLKFDQDV